MNVRLRRSTAIELPSAILRRRAIFAMASEPAADIAALGRQFEAHNAAVTTALIRLIRDPYTAKPLVLFYAYRRVGGGVANSEAVKLLKFSAT